LFSPVCLKGYKGVSMTDEKAEKQIYVRYPKTYEELLAIMAAEQDKCKVRERQDSP